MTTEIKTKQHTWYCYAEPICEDMEYSIDELRESIERFAVYLKEFEKEHPDHTDFRVSYYMQCDEYSSSDKEYVRWHITATGPMTKEEIALEEETNRKRIEYKRQQYEQLKKEFGDK